MICAARESALNDYDAALADMNKAVAIRPGAAQYKLKALIDTQKGDTRAAIQDFSDALSYSSSDAPARVARGYLLMSRGQNEEALADFGVAIDSAPSAKAYLGRGETLMAIGEWEASYNDFKRSVSMDPNDPEALNAFAWIMSASPVDDLRNGRRAVQLATKACELTSWKNPKYILTLASAYAETGDFQSAVNKAQQGIDAYNPDDTQGMLKAIDERDLFRRGQPYRMKAPDALPSPAQQPQSHA